MMKFYPDGWRDSGYVSMAYGVLRCKLPLNCLLLLSSLNLP
jgi:hypothetical protein